MVQHNNMLDTSETNIEVPKLKKNCRESFCEQRGTTTNKFIKVITKLNVVFEKGLLRIRQYHFVKTAFAPEPYSSQLQKQNKEPYPHGVRVTTYEVPSKYIYIYTHRTYIYIYI